MESSEIKKCDRCNGVGVDFSNFNILEVDPCKKCKGTGYLDWIEMVVGKKGRQNYFDTTQLLKDLIQIKTMINSNKSLLRNSSPSVLVGGLVYNIQQQVKLLEDITYKFNTHNGKLFVAFEIKLKGVDIPFYGKVKLE